LFIGLFYGIIFRLNYKGFMPDSSKKGHVHLRRHESEETGTHAKKIIAGINAPHATREAGKASAEENIDTIRREFRHQIEWLKSDDAPLGSTVVISEKKIDRKRTHDAHNEKGFWSTTVTKGVDGLRIAKIEHYLDAHGKTVGDVLEIGPRKFHLDAVLDMVTEMKKPTKAIVSTEKGIDSELKLYLDWLSRTLVACIKGKEMRHEPFKNALREIGKAVGKYRIMEWTYHSNAEENFTLKIEKGALTVYEPAHKKTKAGHGAASDEHDLVVKYGPYDLSKYL
jgi:hypothetical protein